MGGEVHDRVLISGDFGHVPAGLRTRSASWPGTARCCSTCTGPTSSTPTCARSDGYGPADLVTMAEDAAAGGMAVADPGGPTRGSRCCSARRSAPPFLVLHGTADRYVPTRQPQRLAAALESVGAGVRLELVDGADHLWLGAPDAARAAFTTSAAFALEHLALMPSPGDAGGDAR